MEPDNAREALQRRMMMTCANLPKVSQFLAQFHICHFGFQNLIGRNVYGNKLLTCKAGMAELADAADKI